MLAASDTSAAELLAAAEQVIAVLGLKMVDHSGHRATMSTIQRALVQRKQFRGSYRSPYAGKPWRVTLHPYRLCLARQAWYLIARPEGETTPRNLRVVRFRALRLLDRSADVPDDFNLRAHLGNAWEIFRGERSYDVEIHFTKEAAAQVLRRGGTIHRRPRGTAMAAPHSRSAWMGLMKSCGGCCPGRDLPKSSSPSNCGSVSSSNWKKD